MRVINLALALGHVVDDDLLVNVSFDFLNLIFYLILLIYTWRKPTIARPGQLGDSCPMAVKLLNQRKIGRVKRVDTVGLVGNGQLGAVRAEAHRGNWLGNAQGLLLL